MEDYRNKVVNYYATQSQNIGKFTSNSSTNTSKFTGETDWIRLGGHRGPGLPGTTCRFHVPRGLAPWAPWAMRPSQRHGVQLEAQAWVGPKAQRAPWAPLGGEITLARRLVGGWDVHLRRFP